MKKKVTIKDSEEFKSLVSYYLKYDLPISVILDYYILSYPQKRILMNMTKAYNYEQDELLLDYGFNISESYLENPNTIQEEDILSHDEQIEIFKRLAALVPTSALEELESVNSRIEELEIKIEEYEGLEDHLDDIDEYLKNTSSLKEATKIKNLYANYKNIKSKYEGLVKRRNQINEQIKEVTNDNYEYSFLCDRLVTTNIRLVNWVIARYFKNIALPKEETQALALEGLAKAILSFDYKRNNHFSTFAVIVMKNNIQRRFKELTGESWVNYCKRKSIEYWRSKLRDLSQDKNKFITPKELADTGLVPYSAEIIKKEDEKIKGIYNISDITKFGSDVEDNFVKYMPTTFEDYEYIDTLSEEFAEAGSYYDFEDVDMEFEKADLTSLIDTVLRPHENQVMKVLYDFESNEECSLQKCGNLFNVSRERIRQIQARSLRKLRIPEYANKVSDYYFDKDVLKKEKRDSYEEYITSFLKIYRLKDGNMPYSAKAFFASSNDVIWSEDDVIKAEKLIQIILDNEEKEFTELVEEIRQTCGQYYMYAYPIMRVYNAIRAYKEKEASLKLRQ